MSFNPSPESPGKNIESLKPFESLDLDALEALAETVDWVDLEKGQVLFRQGDAAEAMYVVQEGRLRAHVGAEGCAPIMVGEIGPGSPVGEIALLIGGRRNATMVAAEKTRLARWEAKAVSAVIARNPEIKRGILDIARRRLRRNEWLKILSAYLGEIDTDKYELIESRFKWVHLIRGETLFSKGDEADGLYFLVHGCLRVVSPDASGSPEIFGTVFRGEIVGEMAILSGERRMATVCAVRDCDLVRLTKADFEEINASYPGINTMILRVLVDRLKERGRTPRRRTAVNIALVPAGPEVPLADFSRRLHAALSCSDGAARLNSGTLTAEFPAAADLAGAADDDPLHLSLVAWLEDVESNHDIVLYEADAEATPWTRRCIKRADQVLIVARAGDDPAAGRIEKECLRQDAEISAPVQTLVLIHLDGGGLPSGTMAWLAERRLAGHQHLRWDHEEDFDRLARILSRRSVGLVLGGGGARGMAHIGVIRALEERGIPVDMVGGASIGAILGAGAAMGLDSGRLALLSKETFHDRNPFSDYTFPIVSLLRSRKIDRAARRAYGEARIEDLWLSFFCVSCDLRSCNVKIHTSGPVWKAVRTSSSLPGIMVPVLHDGAVHVDGGVMNNLPGDIMRRHAGIVITVDVDSRENMSPGFAEFPSASKIFWSRIWPWKKRIVTPNIAEIMMATIMTGCRKNADSVKEDADLSLEPPVQGIGILDFKTFEKTARAGYEYTRERLDTLPANSPLRRFFDRKPAGDPG
jgi:predicted acylesterase/phospholipase RssA/CRP-like cAMP-binding protein